MHVLMGPLGDLVAQWVVHLALDQVIELNFMFGCRFVLSPSSDLDCGVK